MENPGYWSDTEKRLPSQLGHDAKEIIRKATAPDRHAWRCEEAKKAARVAALEAVIFDDGVLVSDLHARPEVAEAVAAATALLAVIELHGIGGSLGIMGGSTDRMPWAEGLGKGRKQATDGEAWSAAIESTTRATWGLRLSPNYNESAGPDCADAFDLMNGNRVVVSIRANAIPPAWRTAIARRAVLVISGTLPLGMELPAFDDLVAGPWPEEISVCSRDEEMVAWGSVLRDAEREIRDGVQAEPVPQEEIEEAA